MEYTIYDKEIKITHANLIKKIIYDFIMKKIFIMLYIIYMIKI
jgi:hypothetical protein